MFLKWFMKPPGPYLQEGPNGRGTRGAPIVTYSTWEHIRSWKTVTSRALGLSCPSGWAVENGWIDAWAACISDTLPFDRLPLTSRVSHPHHTPASISHLLMTLFPGVWSDFSIFLTNTSLTSDLYAYYPYLKCAFHTLTQGPCTCRIFKVQPISLPSSTGPSFCGEARRGGLTTQHQPWWHQSDLQILPWRRSSAAGTLVQHPAAIHPVACWSDQSKAGYQMPEYECFPVSRSPRSRVPTRSWSWSIPRVEGDRGSGKSPPAPPGLLLWSGALTFIAISRMESMHRC